MADARRQELLQLQQIKLRRRFRPCELNDQALSALGRICNRQTHQIKATRQARLDPNHPLLYLHLKRIRFCNRLVPVQANLFTLLYQGFQPATQDRHTSSPIGEMCMRFGTVWVSVTCRHVYGRACRRGRGRCQGLRRYHWYRSVETRTMSED